MQERSLSDIVGRGYATVWQKLHDPSTRYLAIKGSRASKKSKTIALFLILLLLENPTTNALSIRRYEKTLRNSTFQDLQWAIERLGFESDFICRKAPLEIERISTGQKIIFLGLDDGLKITSISVAKGVLAYVHIEEAFELKTDKDFNKLDFSLRGVMPDGVTPKFILTFNAWNSQTWIKERFFDRQDKKVYACTTTYKTNEFLTSSDIELFEDLKEHNYKRYLVEGLGEWGTSEGIIYSNVECRPVDVVECQRMRLKAVYGVDFGYTDPTTLVGSYVDIKNKIIYVFCELYMHHVTNLEFSKAIKELGIKGEKIVCDSEDPKSIEELRRYGINAVGAVKGANSVLYGIQKLQNFKIVYDPQCINFGIEINNYAWETGADGKPTNRPEHEFSHCLDGLRYSLESIKLEKSTINPSNLLYLKHHRR